MFMFIRLYYDKIKKKELKIFIIKKKNLKNKKNKKK